MANSIKIKQSSVADKVPVTGDLLQGELAINTVDEKLYTKNSSGAVVQIGGSAIIVFTNSSTEPSAPNVGDIWYSPTLRDMGTWVEDDLDVGFWFYHNVGQESFQGNLIDGGGASSSASEIFDGGDANDAITEIINGGAA